jgi:hypothetical protein
MEMYCASDAQVLVSVFVSPEYDKPGDLVVQRVRAEFVAQFAAQLAEHNIGAPERVHTYPGGSEEALLDEALLPVFASFRATLEQSGLMRVEPKQLATTSSGGGPTASSSSPTLNPSAALGGGPLNHTGSHLALLDGGAASEKGSPDLRAAANQRTTRKGSNSAVSSPLITKELRGSGASGAQQQQGHFPYLGSSAQSFHTAVRGSNATAASGSSAATSSAAVGSAPSAATAAASSDLYGQGFAYGFGGGGVLGGNGSSADDYLPSWIADSSHDTSFLLHQGVPGPPLPLLSPVPPLYPTLLPPLDSAIAVPATAAATIATTSAAPAESNSSSPLVPSVSASQPFSPNGSSPHAPSASPPASAQTSKAPADGTAAAGLDDIQVALE